MMNKRIGVGHAALALSDIAYQTAGRLLENVTSHVLLTQINVIQAGSR